MPERRQEQRDGAEDADERQAEAAAGQRAIEGFVERARLDRRASDRARRTSCGAAGATDASTSPRVRSTTVERGVMRCR